MPLRILLVEPEIPGNTGTIGRLSLATSCPLHLVEPLGFDTDEKALRRAGLDYWPQAEIHYHASFDAFLTAMPEARLHLLTTKAQKPHTRIEFQRGDFIVFGSETSGLSQEILERYPQSQYRIPMWNETRSLNLAVATGIVLYEGLRQLEMF